MSRKRDPTNQQISKGLSYVASTPSFLRNFGKPQSPKREVATDGREPLPERPRDGKWARGSDDEGDERGKKGEESDDEWGEVYGGGGDDGPQVVVLKEGRHLTEEEVKRERRRGTSLKLAVFNSRTERTLICVSFKAAGIPSPEPEKKKPPPMAQPTSKPVAGNKSGSKPLLPKSSSAKRKLVGNSDGREKEEDKGRGAESGKKKKKVVKGLLSFDEGEGED
ncbi:hypothetical protein P7C73_g4228, partial [Tremellales sp. Uapishka_1]